MRRVQSLLAHRFASGLPCPVAALVRQAFGRGSILVRRHQSTGRGNAVRITLSGAVRSSAPASRTRRHWRGRCPGSCVVRGLAVGTGGQGRRTSSHQEAPCARLAGLGAAKPCLGRQRLQSHPCRPDRPIPVLEAAGREVVSAVPRAARGDGTRTAGQPGPGPVGPHQASPNIRDIMRNSGFGP